MISIDPGLAALAVLAVVTLVLAAFATAALHLGVDSRPGIEDRDRRPWLVPGTPRVP